MSGTTVRVLITHRARLHRLLTVSGVVLPVLCVAAALAALSGLGWFGPRATAAARFLVLYVAPLLLAVPIWARHRLDRLEHASTHTRVVDVAVTGLAFARFIPGSILPFSGHMLFLTYSVVTTRGAAAYRWLAVVLLIETTVFKLWVWDDPVSWALGLGMGLLAAAAARGGSPVAAT